MKKPVLPVSMSLDQILDMEKKGFSVFPLGSQELKMSKTFLERCEKDKTDDPEKIKVRWCKNPLVKWSEQRNNPADEKQVREWWTKYPGKNKGFNVGIITDQMVVVDADNQEAVSWCLENAYSPVSVTTKKGRHFYFKSNPELIIRNSADDRDSAIDIRAIGGFVVAPGSIHGTGVRYKWNIEPDFSFESVDDLPMITIEMWKVITEYAHISFEDSTGKNYQFIDEKHPDSGFNNKLTQLVGKWIKQKLYIEGELYQKGIDWNNAAENPMSTSTAITTIKSVIDGHNRRNPEDPVPKTRESETESEIIQEVFTEEEALKFMNDRYSLVNVSGQTIVLHEGWDTELKRPKLDFQKSGDFHAWWQYAKVVVQTGNDVKGNPVYDYIPISKWWMSNGKRRMFINGITFNPRCVGHSKGAYNMFRGMGCDPVQGEYPLYLDHMKKIICGNSTEMFNYVLNWMAHAVQKIDEKPRVALVLRGGEGIGKGRFIDFFGDLFGSHYLQIIDSHHLTGNFNSHLKDVVLIFADESVWAGNHKAEQKLKGLISERRTLTELKGKDGFQTVNYQRIMMSSNAEWCVPVSADSRRYVIMDVGSDHKEDKAYFDALSYEMENGGKEALLYDLLHHDISKFDLSQRPTNAALLEQKLLTLDGPKQYLIHEFRNGNLANQKRAVVDLYNDYLVFATGKWISDPARFGKAIWKLFPDIKRIRETHNGKREYFYLFPSTFEMLESLKLFFGHDIDLGVDDLIDEELLKNAKN